MYHFSDLLTIPANLFFLQEIHRVLRPGGKFLYLEHIIADEGSMLRTVQQLLMKVSHVN